MDNEVSGYNGARPKEGRTIMGELSGNTGQVGGTKEQRPGGLYRHPQTGAELVTLTDPLLGDAQSRAAERTGFEYVGPAPEGYVKTLGAPSADYADKPARAVEAADAYNKGVEARLNALEAENARLRSQTQSGTVVPGTEPVKGSDDTKQAAADKTADQTGVQVDPSTGDAEPSHAQLQAEAKTLGVNAKGSTEELKQRVAEAKAEKENQ